VRGARNICDTRQTQFHLRWRCELAFLGENWLFMDQREEILGVSVAQPVNNWPLGCLLLFRSPARKTISHDNKHGALARSRMSTAICCSADWNRNQSDGWLLIALRCSACRPALFACEYVYVSGSLVCLQTQINGVSPNAVRVCCCGSRKTAPREALGFAYTRASLVHQQWH
jgi:hypothetical protein